MVEYMYVCTYMHLLRWSQNVGGRTGGRVEFIRAFSYVCYPSVRLRLTLQKSPTLAT